MKIEREKAAVSEEAGIDPPIGVLFGFDEVIDSTAAVNDDHEEGC